MTECARCGDCCEIIPVDVRSFTSRWSKQAKYIGYPDPRDDEVWEKRWKPTWTDKTRPVAIEHWLDVNFISQHWKNIGTGDSTCLMFDAETRLCRAHDDRPPVCRNFPWYGREPRGTLISPRCSFWLDLPKDQWESNVKPLRQPLKLGKTRR